MTAPRGPDTPSQAESPSPEDRFRDAFRDASGYVARLFRGDRALELVTVVMLVGGCLLILADFLDLFRIEAAGLTVSSQSGRSQHAYAEALIGLAVIGATMLARSTRQWPPAGAVVALALLALGIALIGDLPEATRSDLVTGARLADATPAAGLWVEIVGAGITLVSGAAGAFLLRRYQR